MKKILFLWLDDNQYHAKLAQERGVRVDKVFKKAPSILKVLRRGAIKFDFFISPWLSSWVKELDRYDTVILHASILTPPVAKYIAAKNPEIRIIIWYWNPIDKSASIELFPKDYCEVWVFDEDDSIKYNVKYNTQYYFQSDYSSNKAPVNDVLFVGGDKGRLPLLLNVERTLVEMGLKTNFHVTATSNLAKQNYKFKERLEYEEVLDRISESNAILDIVAENQSGLTLRPLEAMYFKKKLITNDINIKGRDFYDPKNVFILNYDDLDYLNDFIAGPMNDIPPDILKKYDFNSWLDRFNL